jgi:mRNA interferase RelE/StbE
MRALLYSRSALKALAKMPRHDGHALREKLQRFADGEQEDVIKLKGSDGFRLRHGDWRALLSVDETEIRVEAIVHRRQAYRRR